jgi:hypothetical protein
LLNQRNHAIGDPGSFGQLPLTQSKSSPDGFKLLADLFAHPCFCSADREKLMLNKINTRQEL